MRWCVSAVGLSLCFLAAAACAGERPEFLASPDPAAAALPFSEAVRSGELLFLSGQIGTVPGADNALSPGGIGPEAEQTLRNIRAVLERHGASMRDVVKCTVFLADIGDWPAFNALYAQWTGGAKPARCVVPVPQLHYGFKIEVEAVAVK